MLSQTFATNPGTTYDTSFFFGTFGVGASQNVIVEAFDFGTNNLLGGINVSDNTGVESFPGLYTPYSFTFTATGAQTTLRFADQPSGDQSSSDGLLDNVSVVAVAVPEASTFALALPALAMVGAVVIRRRKK